ncbi:MAG TPA: DUF3040 domain-containing protein [Actinophytocola sp.]|nr:DUF3040 domain-containing protein [Actinophytocola sp.]
MALSSHDRKVLAAIEHDLSGQDPELSDLFAKAGPGTRCRQWLPVPLRHIGWLVGALLTLIVAHMAAGEVNPLASAVLTGALILTWLAAAARASRDKHPGPGPMSRRRSESAGSSTGGRATPRDDDRDGPDDDGFCPA